MFLMYANNKSLRLGCAFAQSDWLYLDVDARNPVLGGLRTTQVQSVQTRSLISAFVIRYFGKNHM